MKKVLISLLAIFIFTGLAFSDIFQDQADIAQTHNETVYASVDLDWADTVEDDLDSIVMYQYNYRFYGLMGSMTSGDIADVEDLFEAVWIMQYLLSDSLSNARNSLGISDEYYNDGLYDYSNTNYEDAMGQFIEGIIAASESYWSNQAAMDDETDAYDLLATIDAILSTYE